MNKQTIDQKILLEQFKKVAQSARPPVTSTRNIKSIFKVWLSLSFTQLMQKRGFNRKKLANLSNKSTIILNIGCLGDEKKEYINADLFRVYGNWGFVSVWRFLRGKDRLKYDLLLDLTKPDPSLKGIADGIILSHVLEHIHPQSTLKALKNCFDYLKVGGFIRVAVPYLEAYSASDLPKCQEVDYPILAKNRLVYGWGHCFMYDPDLLKVLLEEAGFTEVEQVGFGSGILGETDVPSYQKESIYLTAKKLN